MMISRHQQRAVQELMFMAAVVVLTQSVRLSLVREEHPPVIFINQQH